MVNIPTRSQLRMISISGESDQQGYCEIDLKIPGNIIESEVRVLEGGEGWFDNHTHGDRFIGVSIVDKDSLVLGKLMGVHGVDSATALSMAQSEYPDYPIMGNFHEKSVTLPAVSGWYFHHTNPIEVKSIGGAEEVPSGFYLRFMAKKNDPIIDNFRVNVFWGKQ